MKKPATKHAAKRGQPKPKPKPKNGIIEESTEGDGGPTGSGGVASQSPSPGDPPKPARGNKRR